MPSAVVTESEPPRLGGRRVPELDAIRGIAIGFVMLRHAKPDLIGAGGIVGVEIFFVLSGFLITSIVARQMSTERFTFGGFYRNRALRLLPALLVFAVVMAGWDLYDGVAPATVAGGFAVAVLYLADFATAFGLPQLQYAHHLWTLAIEEQFYLVWPPLLWFALRRKRSALEAAWLGFGLAAVALMATLLFVDRPEPTYSLPTTWAITLVFGCLLALGGVRIASGARTATGAVIALVVLCFVPGAKDSALGYAVLLPAIAILAAVLIRNAMSAAPIWLFRIRPLQELGVISYGAYLWNLPIVVLVGGPASLVLTPVVAFLSYRLVEVHFLKLKRSAGAREVPLAS